MKLSIIIALISPFTLLFLGCSNNMGEASDKNEKSAPDSMIFSTYSSLENQYIDFNSPKAINRISAIENTYFRKYDEGISPYYGTVWREHAESKTTELEEDNSYEKFVDELGGKGDSMHCTIYAVEALKAGMQTSFEELEKAHRRIWKKREHAGWSIGYLLVKEWNWKAYLIMDKTSPEFRQCQKAFLRKKEYPVWRQPNIPLEALYLRGENDSLIQKLLKQHEFGWGFSHQGIHTWITRFDELKECNWSGAPGKKYEIGPSPLFLKTPFLSYYDYQSHVVIFPPKKRGESKREL